MADSGGRWTPTLPTLSSPKTVVCLLWMAGLSVDFTSDALPAEVATAEKLFESGKYAECIQVAAEGIEKTSYNETWRHLKAKSEMILGNFPEALKTLEEALKRFPTSIRVRWLAREVLLHNGQGERAIKLLGEVEQLVRLAPFRYNDSASRLTLGRYFLDKGADARQVLDLFYDPIKRNRSGYVDVYIASGELALDKHDNKLAAEEFGVALKLKPDSVDAHFGLALAFADSDPERARAAVAAALELNPNHIDSLLLLVDGQVDSESYDQARQILDRIAQINPRHAEVWAFRAVLAHLSNDAEQEQTCRNKALESWKTNPRVDHLIGRKLSQKYRFAVGAAYQRKALAFDADFLPAKIQLAQDLLRLGEEDEGWKLADAVVDKDGYNVLAHNLVTLHEHLAKFQTIEGDGVTVRMEAREAGIYGDRVLELLHRARETLCSKYDVELAEPVTVEIFPEQQDFAIRTFGLPGGAGFLGVCFGKVITANSPGSQGKNPSNWQSVLWHEFCHAVTLQKTRNRMPRWLSEGISVYEEKQADPAWGQAMTPQYCAMVLGGELTPVSELSGAFLHAASPQHLQFAYYQSSLAVELLVKTHGIDTLKRILEDLGAGISINDVLERHTGSLDKLDQEFVAFARNRAEKMAPKADWQQPKLPPRLNSDALREWNLVHPDNLWGLQLYAKKLLAEKQWQAAKKPLQRLMELYPEDTGPDSAYRLLSIAYRELSETEPERAVLESLAELDCDATDAYIRLMELAAAAGDWRALSLNAERLLAVNPLLPAAHRYFVQAAGKFGDESRAIPSYRALLLMGTVDPAETHFRLARLLLKTNDVGGAQRQVLQSLEDAPRFRAALQLLLEIERRAAEEVKKDDTARDKEAAP